MGPGGGNPPVLAEVRRGGAVESLHRGAVVATDAAGRVLAACGDPTLRAFARSALKPVQALPLVADGGTRCFELTRSELAVICASHAGEAMHVAAVRSILRKVDLDEQALQCGGHWPLHQPTAEAMRARGEAPGPIHDNCSGKHAGMLALARLHGWDPATYRRPDHPVQQRIREAVVALCGSSEAVATPRTDGCGVPTYYLSLQNLATAFARLAAPEVLPLPWSDAARCVVGAMTAFPEMVGGTGRLDSVLMGVGEGRLVVKGGAEAIVAVAAPPRRLGLALKIEDGSARAVAPVLIEVLRQLALLSEDDIRILAPLHRPAVLDRRNARVGEIVAVLHLESPLGLEPSPTS
ncbi:MAG: asparaginase [Armatimonadota bacterium]|nr:asparaginase [Armatimonadota bacterium]MDR7470480.1 asparaginase [Armatimonadota bacterium]MDR7473917.1 asparaginase [Armatimonadota bacterium]